MELELYNFFCLAAGHHCSSASAIVGSIALRKGPQDALLKSVLKLILVVT